MVLEQNVSNAGGSLFNRTRLGDDIGAVGMLSNHFLEPANLALDYYETVNQLRIIVMRVKIITPSRGITINLILLTSDLRS